MDIDKFLKKNFNKFHLIGVLSGVGLSMIYWTKAGRYTDNILKSSPVLMAIWGILIGYVLFDLMFNAKKRKDGTEK